MHAQTSAVDSRDFSCATRFAMPRTWTVAYKLLVVLLSNHFKFDWGAARSSARTLVLSRRACARTISHITYRACRLVGKREQIGGTPHAIRSSRKRSFITLTGVLREERGALRHIRHEGPNRDELPAAVRLGAPFVTVSSHNLASLPGHWQFMQASTRTRSTTSPA